MAKRAHWRNFGCVWSFSTARFRVALVLEREQGYRYDGSDENGETQTALDSGELVAFNSKVYVELDGEEIAADYLSGSVYGADTVAEFYTAHRDPDPMNRNCSIMRASCGDTVCIGHYFPDMVRSAIAEARQHVERMRDKPALRVA
jgi:hypothetical protein